VEVCGHLGFDWAWIDVEHGLMSMETLSHIARAADASGIVPIARIPKTEDPEQILGYMEAGMMGVITAHTRCKHDVERVVNAVKYPPQGMRSAGLMRGSEWGVNTTSAEYYPFANRETLVFALVEEKEGVDNIEEILSVSGLDGVVIGPGDLSLTMGHPGEYYHPDVLDLRLRAEAKVKASGKALMYISHTDAENGRQALEEGALLLVCGSQSLFVKVAREYLQHVRS
jgi:2-keto-3-deoxy-L-rhamnonate aldolase RhmA